MIGLSIDFIASEQNRYAAKRTDLQCGLALQAAAAQSRRVRPVGNQAGQEDVAHRIGVCRIKC